MQTPAFATAAAVRHNALSCPLLGLLGRGDIIWQEVLERWGVAALGVVGLWRARQVSVDFRHWCTALLRGLPRPVIVGGRDASGTNVADVHALDWGTMRWETGCAIAVPSLPMPRWNHLLVASSRGLTVIGGLELNFEDARPLRWEPGRRHWQALPAANVDTSCSSVVALTDERALMVGGFELAAYGSTATVLTLATDGEEWAMQADMPAAGEIPTLGTLADGRVVAAGGQFTTLLTVLTGGNNSRFLASAQLYNPETDSWSALPPMRHARHGAGGCVLPSGRFAVVGGHGPDHHRKDGEVLDPVLRTWEPLPSCLNEVSGYLSAVAVAGGLLALSRSGGAAAELFDEDRGRWFVLPHAPPRVVWDVVTMPAAAVCPCSPLHP
eukprot:COSAG01_NODE_2278_length_7990_cov_4.925167_8_plen_383_part_00